VLVALANVTAPRSAAKDPSSKPDGVSVAKSLVRAALQAEINAHNLVVADFNTYFVGQAKILVHDNQPRSPTRAVVPGYVAK
jgi:hypothetical protein